MVANPAANRMPHGCRNPLYGILRRPFAQKGGFCNFYTFFLAGHDCNFFAKMIP